MKPRTVLVALAAACLIAAARAEPPTTAPAGEMMRPTADMAGYGVEQYRLAAEPGEVVAVAAERGRR